MSRQRVGAVRSCVSQAIKVRQQGRGLWMKHVVFGPPVVLASRAHHSSVSAAKRNDKLEHLLMAFLTR